MENVYWSSCKVPFIIFFRF